MTSRTRSAEVDRSATKWFSVQPSDGVISDFGYRLVTITQLIGYCSMPTVLHVGGFQVRIFLPPREHGPARVHVRKARLLW
jgi:hypothetical protein